MKAKTMTDNSNEKFFRECLGWEWKQIEDAVLGDFMWYYGEIEEGRHLPDIQNSLDLQEEFMWPLLFKNQFYSASFDWMVKIGWVCGMPKVVRGEVESNIFGEGETKALAQFAAGMKALGKVEE